MGRHLIGQGDEVRFKNEVAEYQRLHGVPHEQATKTLLLHCLGNVRSEIGTHGVVGGQSKDFRGFHAALNEIFSREKMRQFSRDAGDPALFRHLAVSPSNPTEVRQVERYFSKVFKGKKPEFSVIRDSSDNMKVMDALLQRFSHDPRFGGIDSLQNILAAHPELGADIGRLLQAKGALERHERMFGKDLRFEKAMDAFKKTAQTSLTEMLWKAPTDYMMTIMKKGFHTKGLGDLTGMFLQETTRLAKRELWAGSKFLAQSAHAAGSFVKNKVIR